MTLEGEKSELTEVNMALTTELKTMKSHMGESNDKQFQDLCQISVEAEKMRKQLESKANSETMLLAAQTELAEMKSRAFQAEKSRRKLHNQIQELRGNIRVVVRVRPHLPSDNLAPSEEGVEIPSPVVSGQTNVTLNMQSGGENPSPLTYGFDSFDRVFATNTEGIQRLLHFHTHSLDVVSMYLNIYMYRVCVCVA